MIPCLTPDQHRLRDLISHISETCWGAGWASETEFDVWRLATEGGSWGRCSASEIEPKLAEVMTLAKDLAIWPAWTDKPGCDNEPVPLSDWHARYDAWRASWRMTASGWVVIVDWNTVPIADRLLSEWLLNAGVERSEVDADLRWDITRSFSGEMEYRYSVRGRWARVAVAEG